jgi:predicted lysophospholipase L1 biosynthesis ABC-type transport system permease subunit
VDGDSSQFPLRHRHGIGSALNSLGHIASTVAKLSLGDRIACAFVGGVFGALLGATAAWIFGVYSQTLGPSRVSVNFGKVTLAVASFFAFFGLVIGPKVGTIIGNSISEIFEFENPRDSDAVTWLAVIALTCVAIGVWWSLK